MNDYDVVGKPNFIVLSGDLPPDSRIELTQLKVNLLLPNLNRYPLSDQIDDIYLIDTLC